MQILRKGWIYEDLIPPRHSLSSSLLLPRDQTHSLSSKALLKLRMAFVKAFKLAVSSDRLDALRRKLELTEFPDELDDAGWDYGAPLADVKRLTAYWKNEFDWKKQEADINKLPQYQTQIKVDGYEPLNIHFIHQRSQSSNAIPLLFVHGCMFFATASVRCRILTRRRAWQFLGSGEATTTTRQTERRKNSRFSRRCAIFAQLRLLRRRQKARLRFEALC